MNTQQLKKGGKPCFKNKECESNLCAKAPNNKINPRMKRMKIHGCRTNKEGYEPSYWDGHSAETMTN